MIPARVHKYTHNADMLEALADPLEILYIRSINISGSYKKGHFIDQEHTFVLSSHIHLEILAFSLYPGEFCEDSEKVLELAPEMRFHTCHHHFEHN